MPRAGGNVLQQAVGGVVHRLLRLTFTGTGMVSNVPMSHHTRPNYCRTACTKAGSEDASPIVSRSTTGLPRALYKLARASKLHVQHGPDMPRAAADNNGPGPPWQ